MITRSGARCDVCGDYILPIDPQELVHCFSVTGIEAELHCDNACKQKLIDCGNDWTKLPDGPLRKTFEKAAAQIA
jgi:hypothetical protein